MGALVGPEPVAGFTGSDLPGSDLAGSDLATSFGASDLATGGTLLALALGVAQRRHGNARVLPWLTRVVSLGYAVPGAVIAVGILLPLGWVQQQWPQLGLSVWVTGTILGLMYAYLVGCSAEALGGNRAGACAARQVAQRSWRKLDADADPARL